MFAFWLLYLGKWLALVAMEGRSAARNILFCAHAVPMLSLSDLRTYPDGLHTM